MIVPVDAPPEEDEWQPIESLRLYHAARDLWRAARLHDAGGTLVVVVPHEAWLRLGVVLNALPVPDQRSRSMAVRRRGE